ncbi:MAG TPA: hypothetical protein VGJ00_03910 [Rhabdochlamydiaceae bacterium]
MPKITVYNNADKPHKGRIKNWTQLATEGNIICGFYVDHPDFKNKWGHTSSIKHIAEPNQFGYRELETKNSRYTLVGKELTWEEYVKVRQQLESDQHAKAYKLLSPDPRPTPVQTVLQPTNNKSKKLNDKPYYSKKTQPRPINGRN